MYNYYVLESMTTDNPQLDSTEPTDILSNKKIIFVIIALIAVAVILCAISMSTFIESYVQR